MEFLSHMSCSCCRETELFPKGALEYYTKKNMGWEYTQEESDKWQLNERGGAQGDYREGVSEEEKGWRTVCRDNKQHVDWISRSNYSSLL